MAGQGLGRRDQGHFAIEEHESADRHKVSSGPREVGKILLPEHPPFPVADGRDDIGE